MLRTLRLHNFRTYLDAELSFTRRHLVIGRNNSGKTNLCAALQFLRATATTDLSTSALLIPGGIWEMKNWAFDSDKVALAVICILPFNGESYEYRYDLELTIESVRGPTSSTGEQLRLRVNKERLAANWPGRGTVALLSNDGHEANMLHEEDFAQHKKENRPMTLAPRDATMLSKLYELETNRRAVQFRNYLSSWSYFLLNPERMRWGWRESSAGPTDLVPGGDTLAVVLYQVKNFNERRYRNIIEHVKMIEPDLKAINFSPSTDRAPVPFVEFAQRPQASWTGLSDGTLRCLALAYIAEAVRGDEGTTTHRPSLLVTIEEPENGIFPGQLRPFFDRFEDRALTGQFLFTSHSPYFINFFDGNRDSVTILRKSNGRTTVTPAPPADEQDPDRLLLAEQYSMGLFE